MRNLKQKKRKKCSISLKKKVSQLFKKFPLFYGSKLFRKILTRKYECKEVVER